MAGPRRQRPAPQLNFAPLLNAIDSLNHAASRYDTTYTRAVSEGRSSVAKSVNERLVQAERALTSTEGLKSRPWYIHMLYAPGFYTGYGVKTLPGVREAIEQHQWAEAEEQAVHTADAIARAAAVLDRATAVVAGQ